MSAGYDKNDPKSKYYDKHFADIADKYERGEEYYPDQPDSNMATVSAVPGEVYFAVSKLLPDLKKVGGTSKTGPERVRQLSTAGVPEPYTCYRSIAVDDWRLVEKSIHEYFKEARVYPGKEFFLLSDAEVDDICDQIKGDMEMNDKERASWSYAMHLIGTKLEKSRTAAFTLGKRHASDLDGAAKHHHADQDTMMDSFQLYPHPTPARMSVSTPCTPCLMLDGWASGEGLQC